MNVNMKRVNEARIFDLREIVLEAIPGIELGSLDLKPNVTTNINMNTK
jgi:hypothetical protein